MSIKERRRFRIDTEEKRKPGAYGVELKDVFQSCRAISIDNKILKTFNKEQCNFTYRSSIFKEKLKNKYIISRVTFKL